MKTILSALIVFFAVLLPLKAQVVKDVDGNTYTTISIGSQTWMKENLRVSHYVNGDLIETTPKGLALCNEEYPKYQWPCGGVDSLVDHYGRLYTWYVVADNRKVCPVGWHVPNDKEWLQLRHYFGLDSAYYKMNNARDSSIYQNYDLMIRKNGFSPFPGGKRVCGGSFIGEMARCWWSSSISENHSNLWDLGFLPVSPLKTYGEERNGCAVRCIKD